MPYRSLLALLAACAWAFAPANAVEITPPDAVEDEAPAEGNDDGKLTLRFELTVEVECPVLDVPAVDEQIRAWLTAYVEDAVGSINGYIDADFPDSGWTLWGGPDRITRPSDAAVSVVLNLFTYPKGAAHPSGAVNVLNYALPDGQALTLDDLFADPEQALALIAKAAPGLVAEKMKADHPEALDDFDFHDDDWFADGFLPTRENYAALGLEPEGVRVYFQQYQILPYVFGMPEALVPLELLAPAGPNPALWPPAKP